MKKILLSCLLALYSLSYAQKPNIAPNATVTADGAGGGGCRTGACSTLNDLNFGTCGTQQMWISTTPPNPVGVDYIEWNWTTPQSFDEMTIHHGSSTARSLTGFLMQYWDGSNWINGESFTNLPQQCINTVSFQRITTNRMRITSFEMTAPGQQSNPNFREIEIWKASTAINDAGVTYTNPVPTSCPGSYPVEVTIQNFGLNVIDSVEVHWEMNGVPQTTFMHNSQLDTIGGTGNSSAVINLGSYNFVANQTYTLRAWTAMPNNAIDTATFNDTLQMPIGIGTPLGLSVSNLSSTSADISWSSITGNNYGLIYGPTGFNPNTGGTTVVPATSPYVINGLNPTTLYDVYLFANCGSVNSDTAGPVTFATLITGPRGLNCDTLPSTVLVNENFDAQGGWTGDISTSTGDWNFNSGPTGSSNTGPSGAHSGNNYIYFEASGSGPASLISPAIDLTQAVDSAELSFWMHAYGAHIGYLLIRVSNISATGPFNDTIFLYNQGQLQTSSSDPWQPVGVRLDQYVGQQIWLEFVADRTTSFSGDLALDLLKVEACGDICLPSFNLNSDSIRATSAFVNWNPGTGHNYEVLWGPQGFALPGGAQGTVTVNDTFYTITGLNSNMSYDVYVRDSCTSGFTSYVGPHTFTTLCTLTPINLPFNDGFETYTGPITNTGEFHCGTSFTWALEVTGSTGDLQFVYTPSSGPSAPLNGTQSAGLASLSTNDPIYLTLTVDLSNYTNTTNGIKLSYFIADHLDETHVEDKVWVRGSIADPWIEILDWNSVNATTNWHKDSIYLNLVLANHGQSLSSRTQVRWGQQDNAGLSGGDGLSIDDVSITEVTCPAPDNLNATGITDSAANLSWLDFGNGTSFEVWYGPQGFFQGSQTNARNEIITSNDTVTLDSLNPQTCYDFVVRAICGPGDSSNFQGPYTFCTDLGYDAELVSLIIPTGCGNVASDVSAVIKNNGENTISNFPVSANLSGTITTSLTATYSGSLPTGTTDTILLGTINTLQGALISYEAYVALVNDQITSNDSLSIDSIYTIPLDPLAYDTTFCVNQDTAILSAFPVPGVTYNWFDNMTDTIPIFSGNPLKVSTTAALPTYYVEYANNADSLATSYVGGNGQAGNAFDIMPLTTIDISGISINADGIGSETVEVYFRNGTYVGTATSLAGWTLHESVTVPVNPAGTPTYVPFTNSFTASANQVYGMMVVITSSGAVDYTNGTTVGAVLAQNSDLIIYEGSGISWPLGSNFTPRFWNGTIHYGGSGCSTTRLPVNLAIGSDTSIAAFNVSGSNGNYTFDASASINADHYAWDFGDGNNATGITTAHTYNTNGSYTVTLTVSDSTDCYSSSIADTTFMVNIISLKENVLQQTLEIYPNPASAQVQVSCEVPGADNITIRIRDLSGKEIMTTSPKTEGGKVDHILNIGDLADGVYVLEVSNGSLKANKRLIKQ